jgi:hypothetical protein
MNQHVHCADIHVSLLYPASCSIGRPVELSAITTGMCHTCQCLLQGDMSECFALKRLSYAVSPPAAATFSNMLLVTLILPGSRS